jgi:hypothetical protein
MEQMASVIISILSTAAFGGVKRVARGDYALSFSHFSLRTFFTFLFFVFSAHPGLEKRAGTTTTRQTRPTPRQRAAQERSQIQGECC